MTKCPHSYISYLILIQECQYLVLIIVWFNAIHCLAAQQWIRHKHANFKRLHMHTYCHEYAQFNITYYKSHRFWTAAIPFWRQVFLPLVQVLCPFSNIYWHVQMKSIILMLGVDLYYPQCTTFLPLKSAYSSNLFLAASLSSNEPKFKFKFFQQKYSLTCLLWFTINHRVCAELPQYRD